MEIIFYNVYGTMKLCMEIDGEYGDFDAIKGQTLKLFAAIQSENAYTWQCAHKGFAKAHKLPIIPVIK